MNYIYKIVFFITLFFNQWVYLLDIQSLACDNPIENGERRIVVVIASYNNEQWYQRNLDSVFSQKYSNYRVIYIDDSSSDNTFNLVQEYVQLRNQEHRFLMIKNDERRYKMANIYRAYHMCDDTDLIIELDGDDWLMHDQVLARYNQIYSDPSVWMTYGNFMEWPTNVPQLMNNIKDEETNTLRKKKNCCFWAGLRTYYAWLAKLIALKDILFKGEFLRMTSDVAIMLPMFEMASTHYAFLTEMMFEHNVATLINDHKVDYGLQYETYCHIFAGQEYKKLDAPILNGLKQHQAQRINLYVCSNKSPHKLTLLLESLKKCTGLTDIVVLYSAHDHKQAYEYEKIFTKYSHVIPMVYTSDSKIGAALFDLACRSTSDYCMFADDECLITHSIDLSECIKKLQQTKAHAFFLNVNQECMHNKKHVLLEDTVYAAQLCFGGRVLQNAQAVSMAIYKTTDIKNYYSGLLGANRRSFSAHLLDWGKQDQSNAGLFFKESKARRANGKQYCLYED